MTSNNRKLSGAITAAILLAVFILLCVGSAIIASCIQTDFGGVEVVNVSFKNRQGLRVRAKLALPGDRPEIHKHPGVVFIPGYQSLRESGDPLLIELSRRGFAVLSIDAIGRGNSDVPPRSPDDPGFDETFGGLGAVEYLRSRNDIDTNRLGIVGHSLGGAMAYKTAMQDRDIKAVVIVGTAYSEEATPSHPKNMLMVIGKYDEHRDRMTRTRDIETEWMGSPETLAAFGRSDAIVGNTYGTFENGTARRVVVPPIAHEMEIHSKAVVAETIAWFEKALATKGGLSPADQVWEIKEWCTLAMMIFGFAVLFPLSFLLTRSRAFSRCSFQGRLEYACSKKDFLKFSAANALLMWLYLPSALIVFAIHKFVVRIDGVLPLMVVNVVAFWLLLSNAIGYLLFRRFARKHPMGRSGLFADLGFGLGDPNGHLDKQLVTQTVLLFLFLFGFVYALQYTLESLWLVDFRFIFAFANDLTPHRWLVFLIYLPLFLVGFTLMGFFLHGQLRHLKKATLLRSFANWTIRNLAVMITPLLLLLAVQYMPLFTTGFIPLIGPGSMFVLLVINAFHILGVLTIVIPISTWLYLLTGKPYAGALLNAAIVSWMFASSQVIAPVPV